MRFLKLILASIIVLFSILTLLGLLFPATVIVSRAVDINAPKEGITKLVKDMYGWQKWIEGMNSGNVTIEGPTKAMLGKTAVEIAVVDSTKIKSTWKDTNGNIQTGTLNLFNNPGQAATVVQWEFQQQLKWYPWERFSSMMNDKILGTMMEKNLNNLKTVAEQ